MGKVGINFVLLDATRRIEDGQEEKSADSKEYHH